MQHFSASRSRLSGKNRSRLRRAVPLVVAAAVLASVTAVQALPTSSSDPYSFFTDADTSAAVLDRDEREVEVGMRFTTSASGTVSAIRFLKAPGSGDTHRVSLWNRKTRIATAVSTNETTSGWQSVSLPSPVTLKAGNVYVVSYHTTRYMATNDYFRTEKRSGPLTAAAIRNGVYAYGQSSFPALTWRSSNYWVDVVFTASAGSTSTTSATSTTSTSTTSTSTTLRPTTTTAPPPTSTTVPTTTTVPLPPAEPDPGVDPKNPDDPSKYTLTCPAWPAVPDQHCTGYKHTGKTYVSLNRNCATARSGEYHFRTPNVVYDGCMFKGIIRMHPEATKVTIKNSLIVGSIEGDGVDYASGGGLFLQDVEITHGATSDVWLFNKPIGDISDYTCIRCHVHHGSSGMMATSNVEIRDSYVHDMTYGPTAHQAAIGISEGSNTKFIHNNLDCTRWNAGPGSIHPEWPQGCSSALSIYNEPRVDNILVQNNQFNTKGHFCVYTGGLDSTGVKFIDNRFGQKYFSTCGYTGPAFSWYPNNEGYVWSGNVWPDGSTVRP